MRPVRSERAQEGIVLAIVLVLIFVLVTAVYTFQRRAIIDTTISRNRIDAAEADALARGGLRIAEALVAIVRAKHLANAAGVTPDDAEADADAPPPPPSLPGGTSNVDLLWQGIANFPIEFEDGRRLEIEIEDEGAKLNLNALLAPPPAGDADDAEAEVDEDDGEAAEEEAIEFLEAALEYIVEGIDAPPEHKNYDTRKIAENLLDFIDSDSVAANGRNENEYYRRQDPPYTAWNKPFVSVDQIGLVEDVDPALVEAMRPYVTVHPIAGASGINLNRAEPWVLKLVYSGTSGNRRLIDDQLAGDIYKLREKQKLVCDDTSADPRCVPRSDVGNGELGNGSIYPEATLPAKPTVFRVVATAQVGELTRRFEAIYDTRPNPGPLLLSWRRLRGLH